MKTSFITLALVIPAIAAMAQGKVSFDNNSDRLFVLGRIDHVLTADVSLAGGTFSTDNNTVAGAPGAIPASPLPSGVTLVAALYAGTTPNGMTLQSLLTLDAPEMLRPGFMFGANVILNNVPGGTTAYFQVYVYDGAFATPWAAQAGGSYYGTTGQFTARPSSSITYPNLFSGGPANGTWGIGNLVIEAAPSAPTPTISIKNEGGVCTITYTGVLKASQSPGGSYQIVGGATSPYRVPAGTGPVMFYRAFPN